MGLSISINNAISGLRLTQSAMEVVSGNVANADSIGYSRRTIISVENVGADSGVYGVRSEGVTRILDTILQRELRAETAGQGYTGIRMDYAGRLERLYGQPGSVNGLDTIYNGFSAALQTLASDPASTTARSGVLSAGDALARTINSASQGVQELRADAESALAASVQKVNELLRGIAAADLKVLNTGGKDPALLDMRDSQINELSKFMDLRVAEVGGGAVTVTTIAGLRLSDAGTAAQLNFDARGAVNANTLYSSDPTRRMVGTISIQDASGATVDVIAQKLIRSGEIAGLIEMRDTTLVQAQAQLDELAASLSSALSDRTQAGTVSGIGSGFDLDTTGLATGNIMTIEATVGGVARRIAVVRVDTTPAPALTANDVPGADTVLTVSMASGLSGVTTALQSALGASFTVSATGASLKVLGDGTAANKVGTLSANITMPALTNSSGAKALPFFVDTGGVYTGSYEGASQKQGFAARISMNVALTTNPKLLVISDTAQTTPVGDASRPSFLVDQLTRATLAFAPRAGIGATQSPYSGTVGSFVQRVISASGASSAEAQRLDEGQKVVVASIQSRYAATSGVSVDQEMSNLIQIQNAYSANARILSAVKDMMDMLLRM
jgi:flagellar hook-associated protein 1 FlgK